MATFDLPLLRIEVVGTVADVLFPAYRNLSVGYQNITLRRIGRQIHSLLAKVADGIIVG